ncbi:hypothetical protein NDU88_003132 [Pleurodeles waltl]|uniref:Uncharacterized protein n=1 Tax=Pleurodeles waltl TaxID=8319 RepID=A0AAV7VCI7_PLEWA|nr:hypothetical protein NDU88_003132 [Pleurodeles waltl]
MNHADGDTTSRRLLPASPSPQPALVIGAPNFQGLPPPSPQLASEETTASHGTGGGLEEPTEYLAEGAAATGARAKVGRFSRFGICPLVGQVSTETQTQDCTCKLGHLCGAEFEQAPWEGTSWATVQFCLMLRSVGSVCSQIASVVLQRRTFFALKHFIKRQSSRVAGVLHGPSYTPNKEDEQRGRLDSLDQLGIHENDNPKEQALYYNSFYEDQRLLITSDEASDS